MPIEVENIEIKIDGEVLQSRIDVPQSRIETKEHKDKKIKSIGFFIEVLPLSETLVEINYEKKLARHYSNAEYVLEIQKQPGIESYSHNIKIKDKKPTNKIIKADETIKVNF
mgnify:CR=1 FL=1